MTKRPLKLLPVWLALSAAVLIAGIILMCLMGFNTSPDRAKSYEFEVRYDVLVANEKQKTSRLETLCDEAFGRNGISVSARRDGDDINYDMSVITYVLPADTSAGGLAKAQEELQAAFAQEFPDAHISVDYHTPENISGVYYESIWRGAVALTVGAVVGLIYLGIRFGVGSALTGLAVASHDAVMTAAILAIFRIPTYSYAPLLFSAVAAVCSLLFWIIHCAQLRNVKKDATLRNLPSAEAVEYAWENSWKKILILAGAGVAAFAVAGGLAAAGLRYFLLPIMIPIAVAAYSTILFGPALHVHVKSAFDKFAAKHKPRYTGKKKAEKQAASEASEN